MPQPSLEPEEDYEKVGDVPNVVFPEEAAVLNNRLFVHYCASDKAWRVAIGNLNLFQLFPYNYKVFKYVFERALIEVAINCSREC